MPPKFQSSFIPKGPLAATSGASLPQRRVRDLPSIIVSFIFGISVVLALGAFAYKFYLNYSISKMSAEIEAAREALEPQVVEELVSLSNRISSTDDLIKSHRALTPLFTFLEASTPKTVRFIELNYLMKSEGLHLTLRGEAVSYAALAAEAQIIQTSPHFRDPVFSDLELDESGNVSFMLQAYVAPEFLSYERQVESFALPAVVEEETPTATSTAPALQEALQQEDNVGTGTTN